MKAKWARSLSLLSLTVISPGLGGEAILPLWLPRTSRSLDTSWGRGPEPCLAEVKCWGLHSTSGSVRRGLLPSAGFEKPCRAVRPRTLSACAKPASTLWLRPVPAEGRDQEAAAQGVGLAAGEVCCDDLDR